MTKIYQNIAVVGILLIMLSACSNKQVKPASSKQTAQEIEYNERIQNPKGGELRWRK